ncbi:hypothetical protein CS022_19955 [Veronia nyctiphanis]|uniref:Tetratrico peptide repeat group 5 domain-containing protein n=1 Tax=Veronia nyctiphanis TaxID=1278244 RepID=A0A4Q0YP51_9GAMM|nr:tetratricopeptide repeat protein [Veronia nyctiphanis]RXJ71724.1 hypothetical protein CS022_19955 [Veronia nyctiphanis]
MEDIIQSAIALKRADKADEAISLLSQYLDDPEVSALAHFHIACCYDWQGKEKEAIPHYRVSLTNDDERIDLEEKLRFDALLGLGSSLRCLGEYQAATDTFETLFEEFPDADAAEPFYAMCLYNVGRHKEACQRLMALLLKTTKSEDIALYREALSLYAQDLDRTW